jgi:hypothetical protein
MAREDFKILNRKDSDGKDIIDFFEDILEGFHLAMDISFYYMSNSKQKTLVKISRLADPYSVALNSDLIVSFNTEYFDKLEDDIKTILISQEIDNIEIDNEKSKIKIGKPNLPMTSGIVKKFTFDKVERAMVTEKLLATQKDAESEDAE